MFNHSRAPGSLAGVSAGLFFKMEFCHGTLNSECERLAHHIQEHVGFKNVYCLSFRAKAISSYETVIFQMPCISGRVLKAINGEVGCLQVENAKQ